MFDPIRFLYRYYSKKERILDALQNNRLYFSEPSQFNDPFDCRPLISIRHSKSEDEAIWHKFLYYWAKLIYPDQSQDEHVRHADAALAKGLHRDSTWLCEMDKELKNKAASVRVCCFAKSPRNMMMWAHYAKNHEGLVLQFRTSGLVDSGSGEFRGQDVTYTPRALSVRDYVRAFQEVFEQGDALSPARLIYSTKSNHWESEKEMRLFSWPDRPYLAFGESTLSGILFGAKCPECLIGPVIKALEKWRLRPRLFKASIERSAHKLWFEKYESTQPCNEPDARHALVL